MADFGKNKDLVFDHGNGIELADFGAFSTMGTLFFIHFWHRKSHRDCSPLLGGKEKVQVRLFHITIH
jgi:hypothetical protein